MSITTHAFSFNKFCEHFELPYNTRLVNFLPPWWIISAVSYSRDVCIYLFYFRAKEKPQKKKIIIIIKK